MKFKKVLLGALTTVAAIGLAACGGEDEKVIKIGVNGADGPQWPKMVELAEEEGITLKLVEFADYVLPNQALANEDIDLNSFQTVSFLANYVKDSGDEIVPIGTTVFAPLGLYSEKITDISEVKEGDKIAIPDDASTLPRALRLLESAGLIELSDDFGITGDITKITSNPLNLDIIAMSPQQTPQVLPDVALSAINNGVAVQAGLNPADDSVFMEDTEGDSIQPYINVIAARAEDKDNEDFQKIVELYQTQEVEDAINVEFKGSQFIIRRAVEEIVQVFEDIKNN